MLKYLLVFTYKKFQFLRDINQKILEALALRQAQFLFLLSIYIATKYKKKKKKSKTQLAISVKQIQKYINKFKKLSQIFADTGAKWRLQQIYITTCSNFQATSTAAAAVSCPIFVNKIPHKIEHHSRPSKNLQPFYDC